MGLEREDQFNRLNKILGLSFLPKHHRSLRLKTDGKNYIMNFTVIKIIKK